MIDIRYEINGDYKLSITGHAGEDVKGKDIVCSAVSILFYSLAQTMADAYEDDYLAEEPEITYADGEGYINCKPAAEWEQNVYERWETVLTGFQLMQLNYPEKISLAPSSEG